MEEANYKGKNVRVDNETYKRLRTLSKEEGRTFKEILKRAVENYWDKPS